MPQVELVTCASEPALIPQIHELIAEAWPPYVVAAGSPPGPPAPRLGRRLPPLARAAVRAA